MNKLQRWVLIGSALIGMVLITYGSIDLTRVSLGLQKKGDLERMGTSVQIYNSMVKEFTEKPSTQMGRDFIWDSTRDAILRWDKLRSLSFIIIGLSVVITAVLLKIFFLAKK